MTHEHVANWAQQSRLKGVLEDLDLWSREPTHCRTVRDQQRLVARAVERSPDQLARFDAPLVVATFGGTGVGKSAVVNAIVGEEVAQSGRQRPTTTIPTLVAHVETDLTALQLPIDDPQQCRVVRSSATQLRSFVLLDCPDPDTDEEAIVASNIDRLRRLLPRCDVLLVISTQEKYRSAQLRDELRAAATGCRLIFVQNQASRSDDIRADWRRALADRYDIGEMFFVDALEALAEWQRHQRPTGDFGRLLDLLDQEFAVGARGRLRRANVLDLLGAALDQAQRSLREHEPKVAELQRTLQLGDQRLAQELSWRVTAELQQARGLWERRILERVTQRWGASPFSLLLRAYNSLGALLGSWALMRARSSLQLAVLGTVQGAAWMRQHAADQRAERVLEGLPQLQLGEDELRSDAFVLEGYARDAQLDWTAPRARHLRDDAEAAAQHLVRTASQQADELIERLATQNAGPLTRLVGEVVLASLPLFVLWRIANNFFYESFVEGKPMLETSFYIPAGLFVVLWSALLVGLFLIRLRHGLNSGIAQLGANLASIQLPESRHPDLEGMITQFQRQQQELSRLSSQCEQLRTLNAGVTSRLGAIRITPSPLG